MDLSDITVTDIASVHELYSENGMEKSRSTRERWAVIYKYEGETHYTVGDAKHISCAQSVIVLPRGSSYNWRCTRSGHFIAVEFECLSTDTAVPFTVWVKDADGLLREMRELLRKFRAGAKRAELFSLFYGIVARHISHGSYVPRTKAEKIAPALAVLNEEYNTDITNESLAKLCGISEVYFRKLFFALYGTSPIHYLHKVRVERAKEMLSSDFGKIGDVGAAVGYASIYHFSKMFKLYVGVSPTEYIK